MKKYLILFLLIVLLYPLTVYSQPPDIEKAGPPVNKFMFDLSSNYEYGFDTDLDGGGKFNISNFSINGDIRSQINRTWSYSIGTSYGLTDYDFSGSSGLAGLNPWDKINRATLGFRLNYNINRNWAIGGGPLVRFSGESGADFDDSLTYGGTLGFSYSRGRKLFLGAGVFISSRIENSVLVVPGLILNWQVTEKFRISSLITGVKTELGPRVRFAYDLSKGFGTGLTVGYEFQRFRLNNDGVAVGGVGDVKVLPVWANIHYDITKAVRVAVYSGVGFFGNMELEDNDGDRIEKEDFDPLVFIGGGIKISL